MCDPNNRSVKITDDGWFSELLQYNVIRSLLCTCTVNTYVGYLKLFQLQKPVLNYDFILVDEAQDLTPGLNTLVLGLSLPVQNSSMANNLSIYSSNFPCTAAEMWQNFCWGPSSTNLQFQAGCQCHGISESFNHPIPDSGI